MQYDNPSKMKKYYQLLLIVVSLLSVTALIFYRHEYHRLRYVLEVLNFFGDPDLKTNDADTNCLSVHKKPFHSVNNVYPSWQRVTDSLYIYSAFWDPESRRVRAIATCSNCDSLKLLVCYLWYNDVIEPKKGLVEVHTDNLNGTAFKYLHCKASDTEPGVPHSTSFNVVNESQPGITIPILQNSLRSSQNISIFVCTIPAFVTNSEAIGYFAYHQLVGVTTFIVYGQPQFQGVNIINVPWNFPFPDAAEISPAIEADCILRSSAAGASYVIALTWNEYVVPRYHRTLQTLFTEYSGIEKTSSFKIVRTDFCVEFNDSQKTLNNYKILPMQKTHRRAEKAPKLVTVHSTSNKLRAYQKISGSIISLHQYVSCYKNSKFRKGRVIYDPIFRRFDPDLQEALKFWSAMDQV